MNLPIPMIKASETLPTLDPAALQLVEPALWVARKNFERNGEAMSFIIALPEQGDPQFYPAAHENQEEKDVVWEFLRNIRATHPHVVHVSEVWMGTCGKENMNPDGTVKVMPRDDPNRKEQVMVSLWSGSRTVVFLAEIFRNPDKLGEWFTMFDSAFPVHKGCEQMEGALMDGEAYKGNCN